MPMAMLRGFVVILCLALCAGSPVTVWAQVPPAGEKFTLVLPGDPFKWDHALNEQGQRGWDALMAQQPMMGGLILHVVLFVKTPGIKAVDYQVVVAEFPTTGDYNLIENARAQIELQANAHGKNGWYLLQALTGTRGVGQSFIALILKKPVQ